MEVSSGYSTCKVQNWVMLYLRDLKLVRPQTYQYDALQAKLSWKNMIQVSCLPSYNLKESRRWSFTWFGLELKNIEPSILDVFEWDLWANGQILGDLFT